MSAAHPLADYQSDFDFETASEVSAADSLPSEPSPKKKRRRSSPSTRERPPAPAPGSGGGSAATAEAASRQEAAVRRQHIVCLDAYSRHKRLVNDYIQYYGGSYKDLQRDASNDKRDIDIVRQHHRFVWDDEQPGSSLSWEQRLAKRYWDKLFKEYCLADLRRYKEARIGLRWRTRDEVVSGRGQFTCGNRRCTEEHRLTSWEVNFAYAEDNERRNALVKLRLCPECSRKLNYRKRHKQRSAPAAKAESEAPAAEAERQLQDPGRAEQQPASTLEEPAPSGDEIWRQPVVVGDEEASKEEEFDKYFADMLL